MKWSTQWTNKQTLKEYKAMKSLKNKGKEEEEEEKKWRKGTEYASEWRKRHFNKYEKSVHMSRKSEKNLI